MELAPAMGQELVEPRLRPAAGDLHEHVAQVEPQIEAMARGGLEHGAEDGCALGAFVRTREEPVATLMQSFA
jgi:hypothetical protein